MPEHDINQKRASLIRECEEMLAQEGLSEEDLRKADELMGEIERLNRLADMRSRLGQLNVSQGRIVEPEAPAVVEEFRSLGEFIHAIRFRPHDPRLERREQTVSDGDEGGYLVPEAWSMQLLKADPASVVMRPRATVIPAGDLPDQTLHMPSIDYSAGRYGGVSVTWIGEGETKPETTATFSEIKLIPNEVAAHIVVTDKLLRNAPAASVVLETLLRDAITAAEDLAFYSGTGTGQPYGYLDHPCTLVVNRAVAGQISYADVLAMLASVKMGGPLIWVASQSTIPQLANMEDGAGHLVYVPSVRDGVPATLMGYPLIFSERVAALGSKGDLSLIDPRYYVIKDGYGPAISASEHVYFKTNKTVIKAFWTVDGQPWLGGPITLENGQAVSPFVVLDVPAGP